MSCSIATLLRLQPLHLGSFFSSLVAVALTVCMIDAHAHKNRETIVKIDGAANKGRRRGSLLVYYVEQFSLCAVCLFFCWRSGAVPFVVKGENSFLLKKTTNFSSPNNKWMISVFSRLYLFQYLMGNQALAGTAWCTVRRILKMFRCANNNVVVCRGNNSTLVQYEIQQLDRAAHWTLGGIVLPPVELL